MCTPCPSEMRVLEIAKGFPGGSDREDCLQCGRPGFDLQIWKIPWRREWQPAPLFFFFLFSLQYSCLENPMDRGAWWATVHQVAKSQT